MTPRMTLLGRLLVAALCGLSSAADGQGIDTLTVEQAVATALQNQPAIQSSSASLSSARSASTIARSVYYPQVSASAGVTHTDGAFVLNPSFPPRNQKYDNYATGITASQTVLDFGRMVSRVRASNRLESVAEAVYDSARQTAAMNVMLAYYALMQAEQTVAVDSEAVARAGEHLRQAKAFYTVGKRAQLDVVKSDVDLSNANVAYIRAKNQRQVARLQLENAMGVKPGVPYAVSALFPQEQFTLSLDSAVAIMRARRPEILAARSRVEANGSLVTAAWSQHLPTLNATGAYNWSNFDFPLLSRWNVGVTLSLPIFQGFALQAGIDQARAGEMIARANFTTMMENTQLDLEQQYLNLQAAAEQIASTQKLVEQASLSLTLAEKQYAAGVGGALDVTDARLAMSNARITQIQAYTDYNTALVRLKRAIGILLP